MRKIKQINLTKCVIFLITLMLLTSCGSEETSEEQNNEDQLTIGTAGDGGTYYYVGSALSEVMNRHVDNNVNVTPEATAGGVENARRIANGELDMGMMSGGDLMDVINDETVETDQLMMIGAGHSTVMHVVAHPDSPNTLEEAFEEDIDMGVGEPGSALETLSHGVLSGVGLTFEDINESNISQSEQADALQDGRIEIASLGGEVPLASATDISQSMNGITIIEITEDEVENIAEVIPYINSTTIPAGSYTGQEEDVDTFEFPALIAVNPELSDELVQQITSAIYTHPDETAEIHPAGEAYNLDNALLGAEYHNVELGIQYHQGAVEYYREEGIWDSEFD